MSTGAVLVDTRTGECYELNPIGAEVWDRLGRNETVDEIAEALALKYHLADSTVRSDVSALVESLLANGIVVPA